MGRLIDTSDLNNQIMLQKNRFGSLSVPICNIFEDMISDTPTVEAIPKDQYEARLKADMVAMLTEIQLEIEELGTPPAYQDEDYFLIGTNRCSELIQEKIEKLKEKKIK